MVEFLIVFASSPYNYIIGRPTLNQLRVKIATCDLYMEISDGNNIHVIYEDHKATQECYFTTVKEVEIKEEKEEEEEEAKIPKMEPEEEYRVYFP